MEIKYKNKNIRQLLHAWYDENKRDLPWRNTRDPYIIWVSEIILQQTRVIQGSDYFRRFIERFPSVDLLAAADEQEVLKLWQGLGYYSRARNLHNAAKDIMHRFKGVFPNNYTDILSLKGVGEYTAAAIASFAFRLPHAVVDGNVYRVLSRLYSIEEPIDSGRGKKLFTAFAQELLDEKHPDTHNQAVMELGALQCIPSNPDCDSCPIKSFCLAYADRSVANFPVKQGKTVVKQRFFNYIDVRYGSSIYLNKRTGNDIWKNLYELPLIETDESIGWEDLQKHVDWKNIIGKSKNIQIERAGITLKHVLSHRIINATFYRIIVDDDSFLEKSYEKVEVVDLPNYPVSRLVEKYFEELG